MVQQCVPCLEHSRRVGRVGHGVRLRLLIPGALSYGLQTARGLPLVAHARRPPEAALSRVLLPQIVSREAAARIAETAVHAMGFCVWQEYGLRAQSPEKIYRAEV